MGLTSYINNMFPSQFIEAIEVLTGRYLLEISFLSRTTSSLLLTQASNRYHTLRFVLDFVPWCRSIGKTNQTQKA
jgi:hypothetical protein